MFQNVPHLRDGDISPTSRCCRSTGTIPETNTKLPNRTHRCSGLSAHTSLNAKRFARLPSIVRAAMGTG